MVSSSKLDEFFAQPLSSRESNTVSLPRSPNKDGKSKLHQYSTKLEITSADHPIVKETFEKLLTFLTFVQDNRLADYARWLHRVLEYNVPEGKRNRLLSVVLTYQMLVFQKNRRIVSENKESAANDKATSTVSTVDGCSLRGQFANSELCSQPAIAADSKDFQSKPGAPHMTDLHQASLLGWCVELLQAYFLICDDIMDNSLTRRGRPCWYKVEGIGMMAINDAILCEASIFRLLREFLRNHPCYVDIVELFHEVTAHTAAGQCLDMLSERSRTCPNSSVSEPNLESGNHSDQFHQNHFAVETQRNQDRHKVNRSFTPVESDRNFIGGFTEARYSAIARYKTSFYTFSLPIRLGMYLAGITDKESHSIAESLALKIGDIFQVQDDYLDCYGDPEQIGKLGTDIVDAKCSWMIVNALERASPNDRVILLENYGRGEVGGAAEAAVKAVYDTLDMTTVYREAETRAFAEIRELIIQLDNSHKQRIASALPSSESDVSLNGDIFRLLANKIYRRAK